MILLIHDAIVVSPISPRSIYGILPKNWEILNKKKRFIMNHERVELTAKPTRHYGGMIHGNENSFSE